MAGQLAAHSPVDRIRMTEWKPMVWEEVPSSAAYLPKQTGWHLVPAEVQPHILLLLDVTPAYFRLEAGGMLFLCLDTCNWQLGAEQVQWLESQVAAAQQPVVLVAHHHFLPVDINLLAGDAGQQLDHQSRQGQPGAGLRPTPAGTDPGRYGALVRGKPGALQAKIKELTTKDTKTTKEICNKPCVVVSYLRVKRFFH